MTMSKKLKSLIYGLFFVMVISLSVGLFFQFKQVSEQRKLTKALHKGEVSSSHVDRLLSEVKPGEIKPVSVQEAYELFKSNKVLFMDARPQHMFASGHIAKAINVPYTQVKTDPLLNRIRKNIPVVSYCYSKTCPMAKKLSEGLKQRGFTRLFYFFDGLSVWEGSGHPVERGSK